MDAFWQAVAAHDWQQPTKVPEFRLYHNAQGEVMFYSMEDLPGDYVVIDRITFDQARFDVLVKNGKIVKINNPTTWKMAPTDSESYACHEQDVTVIVDKDHQQKKYWKVQTTHEAS